MIRVSDHAVVRYLERVRGFDVEAIRRSIASSLDSEAARKLVDFSDGYPCKISVDGMICYIRQDTVTTCVNRSERTGRRKRR